MLVLGLVLVLVRVPVPILVAVSTIGVAEAAGAISDLRLAWRGGSQVVVKRGSKLAGFGVWGTSPTALASFVHSAWRGWAQGRRNSELEDQRCNRPDCTCRP